MVTQRTENLTSFIVMDVLEKAHEMERKGIHVIHLEVGEPDFDAPACVKQAMAEALPARLLPANLAVFAAGQALGRALADQGSGQGAPA